MKHGYADVLAPIPLPKAVNSVTFEQVYGTGMPDQETGAVLSTEAEVQRVVDLAINHALDHSDESLAIIAGSAIHADRIREAIVAQVRNNPALGAFFDPRRIEPTVISDLRGVAGLNRDAVILTLGFGRTPHGRTLHQFAEISQPHGGALLLNALGVTRNRLTVVACFGAQDLDVSRLRSKGARMLGSLLDFAQGGSGDPIEPPQEKTPAQAALALAAMVSGIRTAPEPAVESHSSVAETQAEQAGGDNVSADTTTGGTASAPASASTVAETETDAAGNNAELDNENTELGASKREDADELNLESEQQDHHTDESGPDATEPDRLLVDLADRLWQFGLTVETNFGFDGSERIPMVAGHPDFPGEYFVAVLTDDMAYVEQPSLRARDRHRAERLEKLGWQVITLWSVALFLDPEGQANKVREAVLREESKRRAAEVLATGALPVITADVLDEVMLEELQSAEVGDIDSLLHEDAAITLAGGATQPSLFSVQGRGPRPDVPFGLPMSAYGDDQLDELVAWITSDGEDRDEEEIAAVVREELGIRRRSHRVDTAIANAIRRFHD